MSFDEKYFSTHTYASVSFAKYSQYWWSNRFFAALARRYGRRGSRLLEIGSGLGHLVGQLEDGFETFGLDLNHWAVARSKSEAKRTQLADSQRTGSAFCRFDFRRGHHQTYRRASARPGTGDPRNWPRPRAERNPDPRHAESRFASQAVERRSMDWLSRSNSYFAQAAR